MFEPFLFFFPALFLLFLASFLLVFAHFLSLLESFVDVQRIGIACSQGVAVAPFRFVVAAEFLERNSHEVVEVCRMVAGLQGTVAILDSLYGVPVFVGVVSQLAQSLEILATLRVRDQ